MSVQVCVCGQFVCLSACLCVATCGDLSRQRVTVSAYGCTDIVGVCPAVTIPLHTHVCL